MIMDKPPIKKRHIFLLLVVIGTLIAYLSPLRDTLSDWHKISSQLSNLGTLGYVVFVFGGAVLCAIGMPRLLVYAIGGLAFGFTLGVCLSQVATLLGAYATFLFARWSGADFIFRKWPTIEKWIKPIEDHSIVSILIIRQIPISSFFTNVVLGLSNIKQRDFLIGSFIGFLPEGIPAALIGAGLPSGDLARIIQISLLAALLFIFLCWLNKYLINKKLKKPVPGIISTPSLITITMIITLLALYFVDGIPVINRWEPGFRLDVSGLEYIKKNNILLAINDKGAISGFRSFFTPTVMIVNLDNYPPITPVSISNPYHVNVTTEKWDGESIKCQSNKQDEINCFLVSGRRRELLWITSSSTHNALAGEFLLRELVNIPILEENKPSPDFEPILFLNEPDHPVRLLLIYRTPIDDNNHSQSYHMYLFMPDAEINAQFTTFGTLPENTCMLDDKNPTLTPRISDITHIADTDRGILICTNENSMVSYLRPIIITANGIHLNNKLPTLKITKDDFNNKAPANIQVEGVSCMGDHLYITVDTDSYSGGVYQMNEKFNTLCLLP